VPATPAPEPSPPPATALSALGRLPNAQHGWGFARRDDHTVPGVGSWITRLFSKYEASYHMSTSAKNVYLTMDEGYENGYTSQILDTLAAKGVHVVFFCTGTYIRDNPALVRRMIDEGHVVGNHTWDHPNMITKAKDFKAYRKEIESVEDAYADVTGHKMPPMVRLPSGNWSERCLAYDDYLGYRTYFWSFAYRDWERANQPDPDEALDLILSNTHPGEIMLLHAVSKTNTRILGDVIDGVRAQGYAFRLLPH